jgi:hypothetical protein
MRTLAIQNPKRGRTGETVYVPRKLLIRLYDALHSSAEEKWGKNLLTMSPVGDIY